MLTDIFIARYRGTLLWQSFGEAERRLLVQGFRIVSEQLFPHSTSGSTNVGNEKKWLSIHDKLSMELGFENLSPRFYTYKTTTQQWSIDQVCKNFVCADFGEFPSADIFMKIRISFFELAFREYEEGVKNVNLELPSKLDELALSLKRLSPSRVRVPGDPLDAMKSSTEKLNQKFLESVNEFNERLRQSNCDLHYHNGFIQRSTDELSQDQVEAPFWALLTAEVWKNVDIDMKEAIDRRDNNQRDPAFYAARALESAIKIASDQKGWTHGGENGAHNYIDNLSSKKNRLIDPWEGKALKQFFAEIRNPIGHGPGSEEMPELSLIQSTWAIEACMGWIKSVIQRL